MYLFVAERTINGLVSTPPVGVLFARLWDDYHWRMRVELQNKMQDVIFEMLSFAAKYAGKGGLVPCRRPVVTAHSLFAGFVLLYRIASCHDRHEGNSIGYLGVVFLTANVIL